MKSHHLSTGCCRERRQTKLYAEGIIDHVPRSEHHKVVHYACVQDAMMAQCLSRTSELMMALEEAKEFALPRHRFLRHAYAYDNASWYVRHKFCCESGNTNERHPKVDESTIWCVGKKSLYSTF